MRLILMRLTWLAFSTGIKLVNEPNRIEHGVGSLAKVIWEATR